MMFLYFCLCAKYFYILLTYAHTTFFVAKYYRAKKPKYKVKQTLLKS